MVTLVAACPRGSTLETAGEASDIEKNGGEALSMAPSFREKCGRAGGRWGMVLSMALMRGQQRKSPSVIDAGTDWV